MQIIKTVKDMQSCSRSKRSEGRSIGFVPTMGFLHEGHLSLVRQSKKDNAVTFVSIFLNPSQFGRNEDLSQYPRDEKGDLEKLSSLSVDAVFMPDNREIYPDVFTNTVDVGDIGSLLCGLSRPGHFNGVATVVAKLFNIVMPDRAYFGQKDWQQSVIIKKLVMDFNFSLDVIVCPTVREPDGLAMSSRNSYLNQEERKAASVLFRALKHGSNLIVSGNKEDTSYIKEEMINMIESEPLAEIEYVKIVDPEDLNDVQTITKPVVLCVAVRIGKARLIDNMIVKIDIK